MADVFPSSSFLAKGSLNISLELEIPREESSFVHLCWMIEQELGDMALWDELNRP